MPNASVGRTPKDSKELTEANQHTRSVTTIDHEAKALEKLRASHQLQVKILKDFVPFTYRSSEPLIYRRIHYVRKNKGVTGCDECVLQRVFVRMKEKRLKNFCP